MNFNRIAIPACAGTSLMTMFSHYASCKEGADFIEPHLLAELEKDLLPHAIKKWSLPAGWLTHYAVGFLFTYVYQYAKKNWHWEPTLKNILFSGTLGGIGAIAVWKLAFILHPKPLHTHYRKFYSHLVLAHIIFTSAVALADKSMDKEKSNNYLK